ncbi:restriction endonuclease subunit S [Arthrobacter sp. MYb229]|uniref:restriction endonuclease subunit S n=1 Tax=unclassified Arthrobacter TaxID=235627 RepID=UPI000CFA85D8|nr:MULTISPECIES: restriction endonuclease subunit S [unclassified Arthrobacter]PRA06581.1 restriction endonuclease subunit S [Arthrobacter sp. MYb229]PRB53482.1 restriction endonuclease subunit S [Arthrobacter sp. MYb216]
MSRIDELIAEHCPAGVEHKTLGDVGQFIRGNGLQKKDLFHEGFPAIHYGQLHTLYGVSASETLSFTTPELASKLRHARHGDLLIATTSEDDEAVAKATAWLGGTEVVLSGDAFIYRHELEPRYVSYYFQSRQFQDQKQRHVSGTKVRRISGSSLAKLIIPVPPLEIQRHIADILDTFSKMEAELEAELEARKQQYEHYRSVLVSNSQTGDQLSLGEIENRGIIKLGRGKVISKMALDATPGNYPVYSSSGTGTGEFGRYGDYMFDDERITWSVDGGGRFFYRHPHKFSVTNVSGWMTVDTSVLNVKYLYYVLTTQWEKQEFNYTRKAHPSVIRDVYSISLPPLGDQEEVVQALDNFDALVNDNSTGLPAELAVRSQQYEYYRDKLLTFKELEPVS